MAIYDLEVNYIEAGRSFKHRRSDFPSWVDLPDLDYLVGIDQSTTCTGIYIRDVDGKIDLICDYHRMTDRVDDYVDQLLRLLEYFLRGKRVKLFVYEALPKGMKENPVLERLHKTVDGWRTSSPTFRELNSRTFGDIPPTMWKRHNYLGERERSGEQESHAFTEKRTLAEDIVVAKPHLKDFLDNSISKDLDAFDAAGILEGYLLEHYVDGDIKAGKRKIGGEMHYYNNIFVMVKPFRYVSDDALLEQLKLEVGRYFPEWKKIPFLYWNRGESFYKNIRQAMNYFDIIYTVIEDDEEITPLKFRYNFNLRSDEKVYLVIAKSKDVPQSVKSKISKENVLFSETIK